MGGAGVWHLATHYPWFWAAAAPGAGFAETSEYSKILARQPNLPSYEQSLWHLYDATDYAVNLFNCPTIAYSGELDKQMQAADIMGRHLKKEGLILTHLIGPKTAHKYEPETKKKLSRRFDELVAPGKDLGSQKSSIHHLDPEIPAISLGHAGPFWMNIGNAPGLTRSSV